jgi:hypothetical protein
LLACPPIGSDLLEDARKLYAGDHLIAAAMTARVEMERQLTTLAMGRPAFGEYWRGIFDTTHWLHKNAILRKKTCELVLRASETGNAAAHGKPIDRYAVQEMFVAVEALRHTVRRKGGAA